MRRAGFTGEEIAAMDADEMNDSLRAVELFHRRELLDIFEAGFNAARSKDPDLYARRGNNIIEIGLGLNEVTAEAVEKAREERHNWSFKHGG